MSETVFEELLNEIELAIIKRERLMVFHVVDGIFTRLSKRENLKHTNTKDIFEQTSADIIEAKAAMLSMDEQRCLSVLQILKEHKPILPL